MDIIDIIPILKKHFKTLKKDATNSVLFLAFILIPSLISLVLVFYNVNLTQSVLGYLLSSFAVFIGFTINVLAILISQIGEVTGNLKKRLINHLRYNTLYELTIGIIIFLLILFVELTYQYLSHICLSIMSFVIYFMVLHFFVTFLMISRRIYVVIYKKIYENS